MPRLTMLLPVGAVLLLTACGGTGGGGAPVPAQPAATVAPAAPAAPAAATPAGSPEATTGGKPGQQVVSDPASAFTLPGEPVATPAISGVQTFDVPSNDHVTDPVTYPQSPPVGGPHNPVWQTCGFYNDPVPNERATHSQEHGAVWITYRPDLSRDEIAPLKRLAKENEFVLVSPYPGLDAPVVASAWGAQVRLDGPDDPRLAAFVAFYANNGPERGAPCRGGSSETTGIGTPVAATPMAR